ncbi:hypothetical protein [Streptomyces pratensis]|uniref:hypothetical protein n=1 Tax=Streptomyces pratensis TaxID=1169025 RepID=UPI003019DD70
MKVDHIVARIDTAPEKHLRHNQLYAHVTDGSVTRDQLKRLVIAKHQALGSEIAAYTLLLNRFRSPVPAGYFAFTIHTLTESYPRLLKAGQSLGLEEEEICREPVSRPIRHLAQFLAWIGLHAGAGEAALAIRTDYAVWGGTCGAFADGLRELDVPREVVRFLETEERVPEQILEGASEVIEYGLAHGENEGNITRSALQVVEVQGDAWEWISRG